MTIPYNIPLVASPQPKWKQYDLFIAMAVAMDEMSETAPNPVAALYMKELAKRWRAKARKIYGLTTTTKK